MFMTFAELISIKLTVGQSIFMYMARTEFYPNHTKDVQNTGNIDNRKQSNTLNVPIFTKLTTAQ
jgi:hypothetical protein